MTTNGEGKLEHELLKLIMEVCRVQAKMPEDISFDAPLIGPESPLGLDSLDAVEIVVLVQKEYNVRVGGEETARIVLQSIRTLADFIRKEKEGVRTKPL